jgi:hypothetical protein
VRISELFADQARPLKHRVNVNRQQVKSKELGGRKRLDASPSTGIEAFFMSLNYRRRIYLTSVILLIGTVSGAEDWSSCQYGLDRIKRAAQDASSTAEELDSKWTELEDARSELQDCISSRQRQDRCQAERIEYQNTKREYDFKKREIQSELGTLEAGFRSVQLSCGHNVSSGTPAKRLPPAEKQAGSCDFMQSYKNKVPAVYLLAICRKSMAEDECQKCLQ